MSFSCNLFFDQPVFGHDLRLSWFITSSRKSYYPRNCYWILFLFAGEDQLKLFLLRANNIIKENKSKVHFIGKFLVSVLWRKLEIIRPSYGRNVITFL